MEPCELAASTDPAEIVKIHGMAEAIRYAAKRAKLGLESQNRARNCDCGPNVTSATC